ncbi:recombination-associated protein RdgC [Corticibacter populi]|uniref:Recombination-associated protein RdgC n=1 Tax=Corticibacter populi TaxID=1550736 RepID=A0A3M6QYE3_9BURK|nr:recombination-associated protein RdgC [Corticibacter populi]RMX08037.1 recombination-associated protein RdgC [Corticibacter populi]RZS35282.1 recombination associated protein RdgC [Corticibacter populi]
MFKNLLIYRLPENWQADLTDAEGALAKNPFIPCSATQEKSSGWVPPRGDAHGPLVESIDGQWILRFATETKILPASVVESKVDEKVQRIEAESGRKPGKKERRDLKDEARLELLPMAFTKRQGTWVWIDQAGHWLVLDAGSQGRADEIITALVEQLPGFAPRLLQTEQTPAAAMADWLSEQAAPGAFSLADECELKAADETRAAVRYARHALEIEEIRQHIQAGKRPTRLGMGWSDRASFVLTEALQVKKLAFSDAVFEGKSDGDDHFDADVALTTGELRLLLPQLIEALGGEMPLQ